MLSRHVSRPATLGLLEQLVPSLVVRARSFSQPAVNPHRLSTQSKPNGTPIDSKIREQIMAHTHSRRKIPDSMKDVYNTQLAEIRNATKKQDLMQALRHWQKLEDHRKTLPDPEVCRLADSAIKDLHGIFTSRFLAIVAKKQCSDALLTTAKDFALQAAKYHSAEALSILMAHYTHKKDSQTVLRLYEEFKNTVGGPGPLLSFTEEDEALALSENEERARYDSGRKAVIIAAVTAHALEDNLQAAFEVYKTSGANFRDTRQSFLNHLEPNSPLYRKVDTYLNRIIIAFLISRPPSFTKHLMNLAHPRTIYRLEKVYSQIIDGILGKDKYLAADPSFMTPTTIVALTEGCWTGLQTAFIRGERSDLAAQVWDDMAAAGMTPGVTMWTGLLDTYADTKDSKKAMATWNMMLGQGIKPDDLSYRAIISVLFDDKSPADALHRFQEYQETIGTREGMAPLAVYNTVLRGLLRANRIEDGKLLLTEMQNKGPSPDIVTYNTFIDFYGRQKDFSGIAAIINTMTASKITADVFTCSSILTALLAVNRKDATTTILELMRKQGVKPSVATFTTIITHQMREEKEANIDAALILLDRMEKDDGIRPNEVTYTAILTGLNNSRYISRDRADDIRKDLLSRMRRQLMVFRIPTYNILIRSALDSRASDSYLDALALIEEMETSNVPRAGNTWYILFAGLMKRELWDVAWEMVQKMNQSGHEPSMRLKKMVTDIIKMRARN